MSLFYHSILSKCFNRSNCATIVAAAAAFTITFKPQHRKQDKSLASMLGFANSTKRRPYLNVCVGKANKRCTRKNGGLPISVTSDHHICRMVHLSIFIFIQESLCVPLLIGFVPIPLVPVWIQPYIRLQFN